MTRMTHRTRRGTIEFRDWLGVRWAVAPLVFGLAGHVLPLGFAFTSENGERRVALQDTRELVSPREVDQHPWRALLRIATVLT